MVGRVFWDQPVAVAIGAADVDEPMGELERRGLVSMRPTSSLAGQVEYTFKHALIRDVAYAGLSQSPAGRAPMRRSATWLADLSPERPEELPSSSRIHYKAPRSRRARTLPGRSAPPRSAAVRRRARAAFLVARLHRAQALRPRAGQSSSTGSPSSWPRPTMNGPMALEELGDDHDAAYDGDRALPAWEEAIALRRAAPERSRLARARGCR